MKINLLKYRQCNCMILKFNLMNFQFNDIIILIHLNVHKYIKLVNLLKYVIHDHTNDITIILLLSLKALFFKQDNYCSKSKSMIRVHCTICSNGFTCFTSLWSNTRSKLDLVLNYLSDFSQYLPTCAKYRTRVKRIAITVNVIQE